MKRLTYYDEMSECYKVKEDNTNNVVQRLGDLESLTEDILEVLEELERNEISYEDACCYISENIEQIVED